MTVGAAHGPFAAGAPLRASQRKLGRARSRGRPPVAATVAVGASVRWRGALATVERLNSATHAIIDIGGKSWLVPIADLWGIGEKP
jgi:hypothetical protein